MNTGHEKITAAKMVYTKPNAGKGRESILESNGWASRTKTALPGVPNRVLGLLW